jgi:5'-3' exonuclease
MPGPLLVADAPFLLYRAFFALPDSIKGADGHPVNALLGSVNNLLRVAADISPRAVVVCFGAEEAPYRVRLYEGYHAQREPMPDALRKQFEQAPALYEACGWTVVSSEELEADDLLGAYAAVETAASGATRVLTGDRDMYQCVSDTVSVLYLKQGAAGFDEVDPDEVQRRYGVRPEQVPDFIALRGDPSDGIPGAPGIGEKTAAKLLRLHGSLEQLLAAVGTVEEPREDHVERPKIAAALREHADMLRAYREIATLPPVAVTRPEDRGTDMAGGAAAASELGMGNLAGRLEKATGLADL